MNLKQITEKATDKRNFQNLPDFVRFCDEYLSYIEDHLQAIIVSQNEQNYRFYQYDRSGNFQITRPINSDLMLPKQTFEKQAADYLKILATIKNLNQTDTDARALLNNATYTIQQSIGAALDALPAGQSNKARKLNGDLFEHFIRLIINEIGIFCSSGTIQIPVEVEGETLFRMYYQHDLIIKQEDEVKVIGSIKTSSKDRIDKIFMDKFLLNRLTEKQVPHIAIFLNDIQRKKTNHENQYGVNSTFLPGHFKGYTVKLNPLDGVYYCDIRPNMKTESILKDHIKTFDCLLVDDIWKLIKHKT